MVGSRSKGALASVHATVDTVIIVFKYVYVCAKLKTAI